MKMQAPKRFITSMQNNTVEQKPFKEKVSENQNDAFRELFNASLDAIVVADNDGNYIDANPAACELFGLEKKQLIGKNVTDFVHQSRVTRISHDFDHFRQKR